MGKRDVNSPATNGEVPEIHKDRKKWIISLHFGCGFTQNRKTTLRCRQNGKGIRGLAPKWRNFHFRFSKFGDPENESLFKSSWWIHESECISLFTFGPQIWRWYVWSPKLAAAPDCWCLAIIWSSDHVFCVEASATLDPIRPFRE